MRDPGREELLQLEVRELTDLLRHDDSFADLREVLTTEDLTVSETILAGLIGSEDESAYGVVLTAAGHCIVFETNQDWSLTRWERVDDVTSLEDDFAAVAVAVSMQRFGEIS